MNIEEVVVGYCVDINSSVFDDKLRKHSEEPSGDDFDVISCKLDCGWEVLCKITKGTFYIPEYLGRMISTTSFVFRSSQARISAQISDFLREVHDFP